MLTDWQQKQSKSCTREQSDGGLAAETKQNPAQFLRPICWHSMSASFVISLTAVSQHCQILQTLCEICCLFIIKNLSHTQNLFASLII